MRLTVLGGTGRTGRLVVARAVADGHEVTVLARDPAAASGTFDTDAGNILLVAGSLEDEAAVSAAVGGADAVINAAGPVKGSSPDLMATAARHVVASARQHGVRRLVWLTGAGVRRPGDTPALADRLIVAVMRTLQGGVLRDSAAAVGLVTAAGDLGWTVVRAPRLTDAAGRGSWRAVPRVGGGHGTQLPRDDLAVFLLRTACTQDWLHEAPVISS